MMTSLKFSQESNGNVNVLVYETLYVVFNMQSSFVLRSYVNVFS